VVGTVAQDDVERSPILAYKLPPLGGPRIDLWGSNNFGGATDGRAINDKGVVVGSRIDDVGDRRATVWDSSGWHDLGVLGTDPVGNFSQALAINNQGWVVGESNLSAGNPRRYAFLVDGSGTVQRLAANLGTNAGTSAATGINAFNQVVGQFTTGSSAPGSFGLFLDSPSNGSVDLRPLTVGLRAGDTGLVKAAGINAVGQIAATSGLGAVLLSPEGTLTWARLAGGNLADVANWDSGLGFAPNRLLDVVVASRASQTVLMDSDLQAKSLTVGAAPGSDAGGRIRLQLANGALLQTVGGLTVLGSGTLAGDGRVAGVVVNRGTVLATADTTLRLDGGLDNHGLVTGNGRIDANLINRGDGQGVRVGAGQGLTLAGTVHTNGDGAAIQVSGGGELRFVGNLTNQGGAVLQLNHATLRLDNGLTNGGQVQISFGGAEVVGEVVNHRAGRIIASGGSHTTFWDRLVNDGEVRASAGAQIVYFGAVSGAGSFNTSGAGAYHRFEGGYLPGNSPADVSVGDVQFASTLTMEISGLAPGSGHDRIRFSGSVLFDTGSVLDVQLLGGWQPQAGDHYQLFAFSQAPQGQFDDVWLPALAPGLQWDSSGLYTSGLLAVSGVPEPSIAWLLAVGLLGVALRRGPGRSAPAR
jgi:hypothetical protein